MERTKDTDYSHSTDNKYFNECANIALDFLDLTSPPLENPDVFNHVVSDLLDSKFEVYFAKELKSVALGPEGCVGEPGKSQDWSKAQAKVFWWLHHDKAVQHISQIWVSDNGSGGDFRIMTALWDPEKERPFFSGIDVFSWLAPNISIKTVAAVAPTVKLLNLVWDGSTKIVLEAWEADLNSYHLEELQVLKIVVLGDNQECVPRDFSRFQEAVNRNRMRKIQIKYISETELRSRSNSDGASNVAGRAESVVYESVNRYSDWFIKLGLFDEAYNAAATALPISDWQYDFKAPIKDSQDHIKVAILDTGIDAGHRKFRTCIKSRKSFLPGEHDFLDPDGHGTHMAGLVQQVAPNAKLLIGRIFHSPSYSQMCATEGIRWAIQESAHIILCSWGFKEYFEELRDAIKEADSQGILIFASSPNEGQDAKQLPYPARIQGVYAIGACDIYGNSATFTSREAPFLFPGVGIPSSYPRYLSDDLKTDTKRLSGCSIATALAAGFAARILEFAIICGIDTLTLVKRQHVNTIFQNFAHHKYVCPWDQIPQEEKDLISWLDHRFFGRYIKKP